MSDDKQSFSMGPKDCAIIIKQDMSSEMIIPRFNDDEHVSWEDNQNMFITVAISACMGQDDFRAVITKKLDEIMETHQNIEAADGGAEGCDPGDGSGCGGCCGSSCAPPTTDGDTSDD